MCRRVSWVVLLCSACAGTSTPSRTVEPVETAPPATSVPAEVKPEEGPRYVLRPQRPERPEEPGLIVDGIRYAMVQGKLERATQVASTPLRGYVQVPPDHGGGFIFHGGASLFRASTFVGDLTPFGEAGDSVKSVEFGPGFVLVGSQSGRIALDAANGSVRPLPQPGITSVGTDVEGNALALTVIGDALYAPRGGRWKRVNDQLASPVVGVERQGEYVAFALLSGERLSPDGQGRWVARPRESSAWPLDALWRGREAPFTVAVEEGVPISDNRAAVEIKGSVVTVDLETGQPSPPSPALLPGANDCQLLEAEPEPLLVCFAYTGMAIVRNPVSAPALERSFPSGTLASHAAGNLVFDRSCDGKQGAGLACVRDAAGGYTDVDLSKELKRAFESADEATFQVLWYPSTEGAFGLLNSPSLAFLNPRARTVVPVAKENWDALRQAIPYGGNDAVLTGILGTPSESIVLRGYGNSRMPFAIGFDGRVEPSVHRLGAVSTAGARGLSLVDGQLFESLDYGKSWTEVRKGPGNSGVSRCSAVGCSNSHWLRIGWGAQPPAGTNKDTIVSLPATPASHPSRTLQCRETSPPDVKPLLASSQVGDITREPGFGSRLLTLSSGERTFFRLLARSAGEYQDGLVALVYGSTPQTSSDTFGNPILSQSELGRAKSVFFTRFFDPKGEVRTGSISWRAQFEAARRFASPTPDMYPYDQSEVTIVPVIDARGGTEGLILAEGTQSLLWVHDTGAVEALALGPEMGSLELLSAMSIRGELRLLVRYGIGQNRIVRAGRSALEVVGAPPGEPHGLAAFADGTVSATYAPVGATPPSKEDPVFVRRGERVVALPPWSTLRLATDAECAPTQEDGRALFVARRSWLGLDLPSLTPSGEATEPRMSALVRFDERRLCLEAASVSGGRAIWGDNSENDVGLRVIARFDESPAAAKVGMELGMEYRQALSCSL